MNIEDFGPYGVRNVRRRRNSEGDTTIQATVTRRGKTVAHFTVRPEVREAECAFRSTACEIRLRGHLALLPGEVLDELDAFGGKKLVLDGAIGTMRAAQEERACSDNRLVHFLLAMIDRSDELLALKKRCRTRTLYRLRTDAPGAWREVPAPYTQKLAKNLRDGAQEGGAPVFIANEMFQTERKANQLSFRPLQSPR